MVPHRPHVGTASRRCVLARSAHPRAAPWSSRRRPRHRRPGHGGPARAVAPRRSRAARRVRGRRRRAERQPVRPRLAHRRRARGRRARRRPRPRARLRARRRPERGRRRVDDRRLHGRRAAAAAPRRRRGRGDRGGHRSRGAGARRRRPRPGTLASHYAPRAVVRLVDADDLPTAASAATGPVGLLAPAEVATPDGVRRLAEPEGTAAYARALYRALRAADDDGIATILAVAPSDGPLAAAVLDRLRRAAHGSGR